MGPLGIGLGLWLGARRTGTGAPFQPSLKFNDARNSQYVPLVLAAMNRRN